MADTDEAMNNIFNSHVCKVLKELGPSTIQHIHITDQQVYSTAKLQLSAQLIIGDSISDHNKMIELLFYMVDRAVQLKLSKSGKDKAEKVRKEATKKKQAEQLEEKEEQRLQKKREKED